MFSAAKIRAPNATMHFLLARLKSQKCNILPFRKSSPESDRFITKAVPLAAKLKMKNLSDTVELKKEMSKRIADFFFSKRKAWKAKGRKDNEVCNGFASACNCT